MNYYLRSGQKSFLRILQDNLSENSDEVCFTFYDIDGSENIEITREELLEKSWTVAAELKKSGVSKGDKVVILSTQSADNVFSVAASMMAGTIFTIIPPPVDSNKMERFKSVFASCRPKFILCGSAVYDAVMKIISMQPDGYKDMTVINVDDCNGHYSFASEDVNFNDIIYIQYTSGSTSAPKGIEVSYGNMLSAVNCICDVYKFRRIVGWVPFFHNLGLVYLMMAVIINKRVTAGVIKPEDFLRKPAIWIEKLSEFKADVTLAPNSVYESYPKLVPARKLNNIDLSSLKVLANGSEVVSSSSIRKFVDEYKDFGIRTNKFYIGYGLSEATCGITAGRYSEKDNLYVDLNQYKKGRLRVVDKTYKNSICFVSCGYAMQHTDIVIVSPKTMRKCRDNEFGEIWIKSVLAAKGYYDNEKATRETFFMHLKGDRTNYLRTGDIGIIRNKKLYITGRLKDIIIINGNNILPNDIIEKVKENVEEIRNAIIAPFSIVKDNKERLVVIIENFDNVSSEDTVKNKINSCIFKYFDISPYDIRFVSKGYLPMADNGKVSLSLAGKKYEKDEVSYEKSVQYNTEIERQVGSIIENEFSHKADRDDNLLNLGMDSLEVVSLASLIESKFNTAITVSFIFENPSISMISDYIDKSLNGEDLSILEKDKSYLYDEVKLAESIKHVIYKDDKPELMNIFVTGSTGFLGAYLINELLKRTKAIIYCHVRAASKEEGFKRIIDNMKYYDLYHDKYKKRVIPVTGSLDEDNLGINDNEYKYLCGHIDTVYHCGALLNFIYPYSRLKNTNVLGTMRTLQFATSGRAKYFNYISSYSVFDNPSYFNKDVYEDDELNGCHGYFLSYSESKWVCENIVREAAKRGLRAAIYRPGEITGDSVSGKWKLSDAVSRTIKSMIVTGVYPDVPMKIHMTQVDFVAEAVTAISAQVTSYGRSYNLLNKKCVSLQWLAEVLNSMGFDVNKVSYDEWKDMLFKSSIDHPLKLLESLFKVEKKNEEESFIKRYGEEAAKIHTDNTDEALKDSNVKCEEMNDEMLKKYIMNFI